MTKLDFYEKFNDNLLEFAKALTDVFPNIQEFHKFSSGIILLKNIEPKTLENIFRTYVLAKYKDQLLCKDDNFFLQHAGYDVLSQRQDYWLSFIDQLKNMWKTLDDDNKEIIWQYFHVLTVLSDKCHSLE